MCDPVPPGDPGVTAFVSDFLTAFENLDWERFRSCFRDDACVFHPDFERASRVCGRDEVEASFKKVFDEIRAESPNGPPYMSLKAERLKVQIVNANAAIVSFELRNSHRIARRTLFLVRDDGEWRIVHLHASNLKIESDPKQ